MALLGAISLIAVIKRRFEMFSSLTLFLFSIASLAMSVLQVSNVIKMQQNTKQGNGAGNDIGGTLVVQILGQVTSFPLFATIHSLFALQYLRASLIVPLYFDRQITKDSNAEHKLPEFDTKIRCRKWSVIVI